MDLGQNRVKKLRWYDLIAVRIPHGDRVNRAKLTSAKQSLAVDTFRRDEHRDSFLIESERLRRLRDTVAEAHTQRAIYANTERVHHHIVRVGCHMPSRPRSLRARSITSGVIWTMPRSCA